jgi:uncharacterized protein
MALVRILVDGYSLLHEWVELAPSLPRHSAAAREELVHILTRYQDADGTPITIFFDGVGKKTGMPNSKASSEIEILFSSNGRTADDMIERAAHRFREYGEVLAVTDDLAERDIVTGLGGNVAGCRNFIAMVQSVLSEFDEDLKRHNRTEQHRFRNNRCAD